MSIKKYKTKTSDEHKYGTMQPFDTGFWASRGGGSLGRHLNGAATPRTAPDRIRCDLCPAMATVLSISYSNQYEANNQ